MVMDHCLVCINYLYGVEFVKAKIWNDKDIRCATIPLGVPLNQKYNVGFSKRKGRSVLFSSKKDISFKEIIESIRFTFLREIKPIPKLMKGKRFLDKNVIMQLEVYDVDNRRDIDAIEKSIQDAMNGILYDDDSQIWSKNTLQFMDKDNPRVEVRCFIEKRYK